MCDSVLVTCADQSFIYIFLIFFSIELYSLTFEAVFT